MDISVGELIEQLRIFPKDATLYFSGLDFNRLKMRGERLVQVEFEQRVYKDEQGEVVVENLDR